MNLSNRISRRTLLRGSGVAVGLPLLEAMIPPFAKGATSKLSPTRCAFLYVPNGMIIDQWEPKTDLIGEESIPADLPRISQTFLRHRDEITILSNLACPNANALGDGGGDHGRAGANYLTGAHPKKTDGKDIHVGISVDQIAAQQMAGVTRFGSLEMGCEEGLQGGGCDTGYSCAYTNNLAWRTPTAPLPPEIRPRAMFERLFGSTDFSQDPATRKRQELYQDSILDVVLDDANRMRASLGSADQHKLDEYLFDIRDLEARIQKIEKSNLLAPRDFPVPSASVPSDFAEHMKLMTDLMLLAFRMDMTRMVTMLLSVEVSSRAYGEEIGITEAHHGLTHHAGNKEKIEKVTRINIYHAQQFAKLIDRMKAIPEGDGTLLDHSMISYGSAMGDGNRHDHDHIPLVLAGRANGKLKPGRHIRYKEETPLSNLHLAMLDKMGLQPPASIGDSTGLLEGV